MDLRGLRFPVLYYAQAVKPFYHLLAENDETEYVAYVSEQNLLPDNSGEPVRHPQVAEVFVQDGRGGYRPRAASMH